MKNNQLPQSTVSAPFTLDFMLHKNAKKSVTYIYQHILYASKPSKDQNKTFVQREFLNKGCRKNIFAKNMKKLMIFWLIFKFCFMTLTMYAAIMDFLNKFLTKRNKLKAKIRKSSLAKMFLWPKSTWNRAWNILERFIYKYLT